MAAYKDLETALIHGGIYGDELTGAVNVTTRHLHTNSRVWENIKATNTQERATRQEQRSKR